MLGKMPERRDKVDFVHAASYLLKLQIDHVILDGHCQACLVMPKETFETYIISCNLFLFCFAPFLVYSLAM